MTVDEAAVFAARFELVQLPHSQIDVQRACSNQSRRKVAHKVLKSEFADVNLQVIAFVILQLSHDVRRKLFSALYGIETVYFIM